ncbi:zygote arrest protein 1 [Heptranchias perlo]|uniref:zygote arrest protein 1 n=1 Tax=Heptranchias perlo TaxID=212740 RepID=UPI0035597023
MATLGEEAFDCIYSPYNPYSYQYISNRPKGSSWRQRNYLSNYGDPGEYFDNYQRAQLKAILSQVNPNLTPRVRKANTKDVGVQVNPKTDASVQCSLGPRTLMMMTTTMRRRGVFRRRASQNQVQGSPASMPKNVRFRRTMAIYSPIVSPNLNNFLNKGDRDAAKQDPKEQEKPLQEEKSESEVAKEKEKDMKEETASETIEESEDKGTTTVDGQGGITTEEPEGTMKDEKEQDTGNPVANTAKSEKRLRFQFLEQKYGYFHCKDCNARWESAYVWCVQGTNKVYFKQFCRTCEKAYNPYRVEDIICQTCRQTRCTCPIKMRHVDPKRPHRQDLCGRCKGKRLSCDSTFSFKYII